ncbi:MAG: radical SAM protein [Clostridiales bacterium]|nr:radical SAM protein [Clostridiales bacterium]
MNKIATFEIGSIRPPFHANSLLLRVTENCTWNRCRFCTIYKEGRFHMRPLEEVKRDIEAAADIYWRLMEKVNDAGQMDMERINAEFQALETDQMRECYAMVFRFITADGGRSCFLQDGNTMALRPQMLGEIVRYLKEKLPSLQLIATYGRADTLANISGDDFFMLKDAGLTMLHSGFETGCDEVLSLLNKGTTSAQQIAAGQKAKKAGILFNAFYMPGCGGKSLSEKNAKETAQVISAIQPDYVRIRTFVVKPHTEMWQETLEGRFLECSEIEKVEEIRQMIDHIENSVSPYIISDHIVNLLPYIEGRLPEKKADIFRYIDGFLSMSKTEQRRFQAARRLFFEPDFDLRHLAGEERKVIDTLVSTGYNDEQWEEIMHRYLRNYI